MSEAPIHWIDLLVIAVYLVAITAIGVLASRRHSGSSKDYFLASRSLSWVTVGLALFAVNISTVHLIGLASAGFSDGLVFGNFEWMATFLLLLLGLVFAPFYFRTKISTLPEYLEGRYGPEARTILAVIAVVAALFIHIGVTIYAGAEVIKGIIPFETPLWWEPVAAYLDFNVVLSVLLVSALTILYTAIGGLKAVVVTESIQTVLLVAGAVAVTVFGALELSDRGIHSFSQFERAVVEEEAREAENAASELAGARALFSRLDELQEEDQWEAAREELQDWAERLRSRPERALPILAALDAHPPVQEALNLTLELGISPLEAGSSVDFSAADESLEKSQEDYAERSNLRETELAREAPQSDRLSMVHTEGNYTWWIMLLGYPVLGIWYWCADQTIVQRVLGAETEQDARLGPVFAGFIKILPVFIMVLPGVIAYVLFHDQVSANPDSALTVLITELLPTGLQGLVLAGLLAAMMSTVAGALNSTATLVSIDIVQRTHPNTPDRRLVRIGRITTVVVMLIAMAWSTQGQRFGGIFQGINAMIAVLSPPVSTVFIWGIFWRRGTSRAALTTLVAGFILGGIVFFLDFPAFGLEFVTEQLGIPFMLQAFCLFVISSFIYVVTSYLTEAPRPEQVEQYCWKSPLAVLTEERFQGIADPRLLGLLLLIAVGFAYSLLW